jgi:hypothetical protein
MFISAETATLKEISKKYFIPDMPVIVKVEEEG